MKEIVNIYPLGSFTSQEIRFIGRSVNASSNYERERERRVQLGRPRIKLLRNIKKSTWVNILIVKIPTIQKSTLNDLLEARNITITGKKIPILIVVPHATSQDELASICKELRKFFPRIEGYINNPREPRRISFMLCGLIGRTINPHSRSRYEILNLK